MSAYEKLDALVIARIEGGIAPFFLLEASKEISEELTRLARLSGREEFRILDGRLTNLRRKGSIVPSSKGWSLAK